LGCGDCVKMAFFLWQNALIEEGFLTLRTPFGMTVYCCVVGGAQRCCGPTKRNRERK
jgi:hypothetical protein